MHGLIKMKPTRTIVKPNTDLWKPKGRVWYLHNSDWSNEMEKQYPTVGKLKDATEDYKKNKERIKSAYNVTS